MKLMKILLSFVIGFVIGVVINLLVNYAARAADQDQITEIVVTASRQGSQSLQTIPSSITVVDLKAQGRLGATDLSGVAASVPSLTLEQGAPGLNKIDIRGITVENADVLNNIDSRPLVAVYIDDTPIALDGFNPDLKVFDIDRIEVLRGPQGTLYGASSMAGTIRYITKKPDPEQFSGSDGIVVSDTVGGGINYGIKASVNLPLNSQSAVLLSGYDGRDSGWINNIQNGQNDENWDRSTQGRTAFRWKPTDYFMLDASVLFEELNTGGSNFSFSGLDHNQYASLTPTPITDNMKVYNVTETITPEPYSIFGGYADIGNIISSTSFTTRTTGFNDQGQYLSELYFGVTEPTTYANQNTLSQFSQEVRVVSRQDQNTKWILGAFYNHLDRENYQDDSGVGFGQVTEEYFGTTPQALGAFGPNSVFSGTQDVHERDFGVFGEMSWKFFDRLELTAGARYFNWQQHFNLYFGGPGGNNTITQDGQQINGPLTESAGESAKGVNPRFVANYKLTDNTNIFAEAAKGFRYGGVNEAVPNGLDSNACGFQLQSLGLSSAPATYGPDNLWSYSLGEKSLFLDDKLRINATLFVIDWKNVQEARYLSCSYTYTVNAGTVISKGGELEATYKLTQALTIGLNGSFTHAAADGALPAVGGESGDLTPYTPEWLGAAAVDYKLGSTRFDVEYSYHGRSGTRFDTSDPNYIVLPAYKNLNLAETVDFGNTQIGVFARNVLNSSQVTMIYPDLLGTQPGNQVAYARPRTIGLRFSQQF